jgi:hypothetical protein
MLALAARSCYAVESVLRDKATVLDRLIRLCDELEIFPGGAARWADVDLIETAQVESMALVQLSAVIEEEFAVAISREEMVSKVRTLEQVAQFIVTAHTLFSG